MKKFTRLLMVLVVLLSMLANVAVAENTGTANDSLAQMDWERIGWQADPESLEWKEDTSPVTLTYYINAPAFAQTWEDPTALRVTEKTGVSLQITKPVSGDGQKLMMMIAGNQLPDIVTLDRNDPALQEMIDAGMVWALDDLIDQYAPNMRDILPKEILTNYRSADGKTYRLTCWVQGEAWQTGARVYNQIVGTNQKIMSVRKDYYEEIGSPQIQTQDDLIAALEKMHELHPDKIAFYPADDALAASTLATNASMGNLGAQFGMGPNMTDQNGAILWQARSEQFQDTISFLNKLYLKGLLTKDPFIDSKDANAAKIARGDVIAYTWTISDGEKVPADNLDTQYMIVGPLDTYSDIRTGAGWRATVISKNCKDPARAIRFLEYLCSVEGHIDVSWGIEGDEYSGDPAIGPHWHMVDGKPTLLAEYVAAKNADWDGVAAQDGLGKYNFCTNELIWNLPWWDETNDRMAQFNNIYGPLVVFAPELELTAPLTNSDEGIILTKAHSLLQEYIVKMVFTENWQTEYDKFIAEIDAIGMDKVEAFYDAQYQTKLQSMK